MPKRLICVCHNSQQYQNIIGVIDFFQLDGDIIFLDLGGVVGWSPPISSRYCVYKIAIPENKNFHLSPLIIKLKLLYQMKSLNVRKDLKKENDKFIGLFGVFGPLEKKIAEIYGINEEDSFLIQDAIYFSKAEKSVKGYLRNYFLYAAKHRFQKLSKIFVSGCYTKNKFIKEGVKKEKIVNLGIPRFQYEDKEIKGKNLGLKNVLYLGGAWAWHGYHDMQIVETQLFLDLSKKCREEAINFFVKEHPRGERTPDEIENKQVEELSREETLVVSYCSTLMFELAAKGWMVAYIDPPAKYKYFVEEFEDHLYKLNLKEPFVQQIEGLISLSDISYFINQEHGFSTGRLIARQIMDYLASGERRV